MRSKFSVRGSRNFETCELGGAVEAFEAEGGGSHLRRRAGWKESREIVNFVNFTGDQA